MNLSALDINREILFVINIGEFMQVAALYRTYKDVDTTNDNICELTRYIW